jgi:hypothetical protein
MKRISFIAAASIASALVLTSPAQAGLLGGSGSLGGGLGGTFGGGNGAIGGSLDGSLSGRVTRPDTSRVNEAAQKTQDKTAAARDGAMQKAGEAKAAATAKAGETKAQAAQASSRQVDTSVNTSTRAQASRDGASIDGSGATAATR